jgi:protein TonB
MAGMLGLATWPPFRGHAFFTASLTRFFALSLLCHLMVLMLWPKAQILPPTQAPITVSLAPQPEAPKTPAMRLPKGGTISPKETRNSQAIVRNQPSPKVRERETMRESVAKKNVAQPEPAPPPTPATPPPRPPAREEIPEKSVIAERELPTVKQLLPSLSGSSIGAAGSAQGRVPLETKEPLYVTYFTAIKRSIDANWRYPELALRYGLEGRLIVEFEILESGQLQGLRLIRSSGSALLDDEALRAIRSAAPFAPIPRWIEQKPLAITARMEYHDSRLSRPLR